jgi:hypothetical protein
VPIVVPNGGSFWGEVAGVLKRLKTHSDTFAPLRASQVLCSSSSNQNAFNGI